MSRCEAISDLLVLEREYEHFVDGGNIFFQRALSVRCQKHSKIWWFGRQWSWLGCRLHSRGWRVIQKRWQINCCIQRFIHLVGGGRGCRIEFGLDGGGVWVEFQVDLGNGVICWSPNDGWDGWEWKTIHDLVDGGWNGDRLVLMTDNTSKIPRHHWVIKYFVSNLMRT